MHVSVVMVASSFLPKRMSGPIQPHSQRQQGIHLQSKPRGDAVSTPVDNVCKRAYVGQSQLVSVVPSGSESVMLHTGGVRHDRRRRQR